MTEKLNAAVVTAPFAKRCSCCGAVYTLAQWTGLPRVGLQVLSTANGYKVTSVDDYRACAGPGCTNTLCVDLVELADERRRARRAPGGWRRVA